MRNPRARTRWLLAAGALLSGSLATSAVAAPPAPTLTSGPGVGGASPYTTDLSPSFTWNPDVGIFSWSVNGGPGNETLFGSAQAPDLGEGVHTFSVVQTDDTGTSDPASVVYRVDTAAPPALGVNVSSEGPAGANGWFNAASGQVNFSAACGDGGVAPLTSATVSPPAVSAGANYNDTPTGRCEDEAGKASTVAGPLVRADRVAPALNRTVSPPAPPATANGWYRGNVTVSHSCTDSGGSGVPGGSCPGGLVLNRVPQQGVFTVPAAQISDVAGNPSNALGALEIRRDTIAPPVPIQGAPDGATNQATPKFSWLKSVDATSGVQRYEVQVRRGGTLLRTYAIGVPAGDPSEVSFMLPAGDALTPGDYTWQVRSIDFAGNPTATSGTAANYSAPRPFTYDPNIPDAPTVTGGPRGFTRDNTPTFNYSGAPGALFTWNVIEAGSGATLQTGGPGTEGTATLAPLGDGEYRFQVRQANSAGSSSGPATIVFAIDTAAPGAPAVTSGPGTTGDPQPTFAWTGGEPGATFQWRVTNGAGTSVLGPGTVGGTSLRLPSPLGGGTYAFQVRQVDQAGNESPWSAGQQFTIVAAPQPSAPATPPSASGGTQTPRPGTVTRIVPKIRNAKALTPRAGLTVKTLRPRLSWTRVRGATLYNVQVYRMVGSRPVKVLSVFPRGTRYVVPNGKLRKGQRYQWRVWPYFGKLKRYSRREHGTSWFDVSRTAKAPKAKVVRRTATTRR